LSIPKHLQALLARIERLEAELPPLTPRERAEKAYQEAQQRESEARKALGRVRGELQQHADKLPSLALDDVAAWAIRLSELNAVFDAFADVVKLRATEVERARLKVESELAAPDPELVRLRARFYSLREELHSLPWNSPRIPEIDAELREISQRLPKEFVPS
jgi:DNA repair exonuclease SbcCD ATPase subunit